MNKERLLGQLLIRQNLITEKDLEIALKKQEETSKSLGRLLIELGMIKEDSLIAILAIQAGIPYVDLTSTTIDRTAVALVDEKIARKFNVIPVNFEDGALVVATSNPSNVMAFDELRIKTGYVIKPVISPKTDIIEAINYQYGMSFDLEQDIGIDDGEELDLKAVVEDAPVVKLVNLIIARACNAGASDIHIEPQEKDVRVRYRVDGVLQEVMRFPKKIQAAILSRFKIMALMDIAEQRKPQDGHTSLRVGGKLIDFRVATLPTVHGERIVLRILLKESIMIDLDHLGFSESDLQKFKSVYKRPYGTILVTGPTGSGKSTTLYATLNILNVPEKNIVTIEDPVEYRLKGLNQVQINTKAKLTFARGLRSILRTSPDVIMVGEIRDQETAQIAIEAALTGHLVLSTLHTNDAPGALSRLIEMEIEPFLVSSAITAVQAQRLARKLCSECRKEYVPELEALQNIGFPLDGKEVPAIYKANGCNKCNNTGYKGRIGLYEVMIMDEEIQRMTLDGASADEIKNIAVNHGMKTLAQDGFEKVLLGVTSIEEVLRVVV